MEIIPSLSQLLVTFIGIVGLLLAVMFFTMFLGGLMTSLFE
jgi:hypothetical protein